MKDFGKDFLGVDKKRKRKKGFLGGYVLGCWTFLGSGFNLIGLF